MGAPSLGFEEKGFAFAGEPADSVIPAVPNILFDVDDKANLYTKVLGDLGMIKDPDLAGKIVQKSMLQLHTLLSVNQLPDDEAVEPFFSIDLPEDDADAFDKAIAVFNRQGEQYGSQDIDVGSPLYGELTSEELNRRSFAGEAAVKGWSARAMVLGGHHDEEQGLYFPSKHVEKQIAAFKAMREAYNGSHKGATMAIMNIFDHLIINAARLQEGARPLLGRFTHSRTPQAGNPVNGLKKVSDGDSLVPSIFSSSEPQIFLGGHSGDALYGYGLRISVGQTEEA